MQLANDVQSELIKATGLRNRGVKTANFHVLRESRMPAILAECGFMDNRRELNLLKSDSYRRKCAVAIAKGIAATFGLKKKSAPAPKPVKPDKLYRVQVGAFSDKKNAENPGSRAEGKEGMKHISRNRRKPSDGWALLV